MIKAKEFRKILTRVKNDEKKWSDGKARDLVVSRADEALRSISKILKAEPLIKSIDAKVSNAVRGCGGNCAFTVCWISLNAKVHFKSPVFVAEQWCSTVVAKFKAANKYEFHSHSVTIDVKGMMDPRTGAPTWARLHKKKMQSCVLEIVLCVDGGGSQEDFMREQAAKKAAEKESNARRGADTSSAAHDTSTNQREIES